MKRWASLSAIHDLQSSIQTLLAEEVIGEDKDGHGFDDGDGAGEDAWVVAAFAGEVGVVTGSGDGWLRSHDGGGGFEGHPEQDGLAIGDAALDAARAVAGGADLAVDHAERIIVLAAGEQRAGKP